MHTKTSETNTLAIAYINASKKLLFFNRVKNSKENVEKVVKPPQSPVIKNNFKVPLN